MRLTPEEKARIFLKGNVKELGTAVSRNRTLFSFEMPQVTVEDAYNNPKIVACTCKQHSINPLKIGTKCQYTIAVMESLKQ